MRQLKIPALRAHALVETTGAGAYLGRSVRSRSEGLVRAVFLQRQLQSAV
jgi:hypothetical protein